MAHLEPFAVVVGASVDALHRARWQRVRGSRERSTQRSTATNGTAPKRQRVRGTPGAICCCCWCQRRCVTPRQVAASAWPTRTIHAKIDGNQSHRAKEAASAWYTWSHLPLLLVSASMRCTAPGGSERVTQQHHSAALLLHHTTAFHLHHSAALLQNHSTDLLLHHSTALHLHLSTALHLHHSTALHPHHSTALHQHHSTALLLHHSTALHLHHSTVLHQHHSTAHHPNHSKAHDKHTPMTQTARCDHPVRRCRYSGLPNHTK